MKRTARSHPIGYRTPRETLVLGAVPPLTDRQRAAVPTLVASRPDADTLADMLLGEAL